MDRLDNTVRPYAWGSTTAIPKLLGLEPTGEPQAEMWMGARPVREGAPGWAPIHISACGSPVGSTPSSRGMAVVEPQA